MKMKKMVILIMAAILGIGRPAAATMSSTDAREALFTGDGSTKAFTFTFPIDKNETSNLEVWLRTTATGAQAQQTETTHYSVSATNNNYASGGTVTMVTAPAATQKLLILRATPQTQNSNIGSSGILLTLENAFDKQQRQIIDLQEAVNRCLKFPKTDATTLSSVVDDSVSRASQYLGFNSLGVPTILSSGLDVGTVTATAFGQTLVDDADAEEARGTLELGTTDAVQFAGITGTTGTFSSAISGTTGTYSGGLSATTGTFSGAVTAAGAITANAGLTLGAGDDLIGSTTSDVNVGGTFTVAGATGNTVIAGTCDITGATEVKGITTIGDGSLLKTSAAPSTDAMIANKKYVDDQIATAEGDASTTDDSESNTMLKAHAYKAQTAGYVNAYVVYLGTVQIYIGDTNDPAGAGSKLADQGIGVGDQYATGMAFCPKDYRFEVTGAGTPTIYWTPLIAGGGAPIDQD